MRTMTTSGRQTIPKFKISIRQRDLNIAVDKAYNFFNSRCLSVDEYTGISGISSRFEVEMVPDLVGVIVSDTDVIMNGATFANENNTPPGPTRRVCGRRAVGGARAGLQEFKNQISSKP